MIRILTFLFATSAFFCASASAGPRDSRDGQTTEVESTLASQPRQTEVAEVAVPGRAALLTISDAVADGGNPLHKFPLSALGGTLARPLFSASRRPPVPILQPAVPPAPTPIIAAPTGPQRPPWTLIGAIVTPNTSFALLKNSTNQAVMHMRVGQQELGWRLREITVRSILLEHGTQSITIGFPDPHDVSLNPVASDVLGKMVDRRGLE